MSGKILAFAAIIAVASVLIFSVQPIRRLSEFEKFKLDHGKVYSSIEEEEYRRSIFMMNVTNVARHNADKTKTYTIGINQFSDLTQAEFIKTYLQAVVNTKFTTTSNARTMMQPEKLGDVDWVAQGKVTQIKNQGQCGSCWAFSATGAIESAYLLTGRSELLSEQQLVDCSGAYGNHGCQGGWMDSAFAYVRDHGLNTESAYPYVAVDQKCKSQQGGPYKISGFVDVPTCGNLKNALNSRPVSVAVDAGAWAGYRDGIFSGCGSAINHGVLVVGVTDNYWKVKNSWGTGWGENGFIRLAAGDTCSICGYGSYPTL